eukprot:3938644-Rhodomonas_salina.1
MNEICADPRQSADVGIRKPEGSHAAWMCVWEGRWWSLSLAGDDATSSQRERKGGKERTECEEMVSELPIRGRTGSVRWEQA